MKQSIRTLMFTGITAASLALVTAGVYAQNKMGRNDTMRFNTSAPPGMGAGHMGGHERMGEQDIMRMAERLNLTQDQRDKIGKIIDEARPKMRKNGFDLMDNRKELHTLMQEDKVNDKKLRSLTRRQGELMADMMYLRMKMRSDIHAVLTDEQRQQMMEHKGRFFRHGMRGDMPPMSEMPPMPGKDS